MIKNQLITTGMPSISSFESYKQYVYNIPNLTEKEEEDLFNLFYKNNSLESVQKIILSQLKNVVYIASKYKGYGILQEDLVQEGNIGLMKAVKNYDLKHKVRLYTYAIIWIKSEIQSYILKNWKIVKIATTNNFKKLFFNFKSIQKQLMIFGVSKIELIKNISTTLNVSEQETREIAQYFSNEDISIFQENQEGENIYLELPTYKTPETEYQKKHDSLILHNKLDLQLESLNENQKFIINARFFSEEKETHKSISKKLKISSERVRQIEKEALNKLKLLLT